MPKHMTPRAIAANRRNAQRSTGPRTPEGKARSSLNAVTHGILARTDIIPPSLQRYEDPAAYLELYATYRAELQAADLTEEAFVGTLAACHWRLARPLPARRRVRRAEGAAIAQAQARAGAANERRAHLINIVTDDCAAIQAALDAGDMAQLRRVLDPQGLYPSCDTDAGAIGMAIDQLQRSYVEPIQERVQDPQTAVDLASMPDMKTALRFAAYEAHLMREYHHALTALQEHQDLRRQAAPVGAGSPRPVPPPAAGAPSPHHPAPSHEFEKRTRSAQPAAPSPTPPRRGNGRGFPPLP